MSLQDPCCAFHSAEFTCPAMILVSTPTTPADLRTSIPVMVSVAFVSSFVFLERCMSRVGLDRLAPVCTQIA